MILTPDQQDELREGGTTFLDGGQAQIVSDRFKERTRWGYLNAVTFRLEDMTTGNEEFWEFEIEDPSGDSDVDTYDIEAYRVMPVETVVTVYRRLDS